MTHTLVSMLESSGYNSDEAEGIAEQLKDYPTDYKSILEIPLKFSRSPNPSTIQAVFNDFLALPKPQIPKKKKQEILTDDNSNTE